MTIKINAHTWYNLNGHIVRKGGSVRRCTIGAIIFNCENTGNVPVIEVFFSVSGVRKRKLILPTSLLSIHILWLSNEFVSDTEDNMLPVDNVLPPLRLTGVHPLMTKNNHIQWDFIIRNLHQMYQALVLVTDVSI
jgi:hypothetical protein